MSHSNQSFEKKISRQLQKEKKKLSRETEPHKALTMQNVLVPAAAQKAHATLPFAVRAAGQHDVPALVDIYLSAFKDDFDITTTAPLECEFRANWAQDLLAYISEPNVHVLKAVEQVDGSEVIAAWALWTLHEDDEGDIPSDYDSAGSDSSDDGWWAADEDESEEDSENEIFWHSRPSPLMQNGWREPSSLSKPRVPVERKPPINLEVIATSPEDQRRGAESLLLEHVLIEADELGLEVHAEASSTSAPLYRGFGFEDRGRIGLAGKAGSDHHLVMARTPDARQRLKHGVGQRYY